MVAGRIVRHWTVRLGGVLAALALPAAARADHGEATLAILRVKPATVLILTQVEGQVRTRCGGGPFLDVTVPPFETTGSGFIVHPDGWIITNGHVVQRYHEPDEGQFRRGILRAAVGRACLPRPEGARGQPPRATERNALLDRLAGVAARDAVVQVRRRLLVFLPSGKALEADVKVYSGPIAPAPTEQEEAMAPVLGKMPGRPRGGRDVAVLKVPASALPVARLGDSDAVRVGDPVHIIGYPGVVLQHELLARTTRTEASVTSGTISALRRDAQGSPVIQTDAPVSWGNSGGPMVNARGEVVGIVTFISLAEGGEGQAIQGFNFAVPANIARQVAQGAGFDMEAPSPFNALWDAALRDHARGLLPLAIARLERLAREAPEQPDVARFLADARARFAALPFYRRRPVLWGLVGAAGLVAGGIAAGATLARRAARRRAAEIKRLAREELLNLIGTAHPTILDVRTPEALSRRPSILPGAMHIPPDEVLERCKTLPVTETLVLYCD